MRGIKMAALGAVVVAGSFVVLGVQPGGIVNFYRDNLNPAGFALWVVGLMIATLAPPVLAIAFWYGSMRFRRGWLLHLLLVPAIYVAVRGAITVMLLAAHEPDRDGLTGWATDPAALLMLFCPVVYFLALGIMKLPRRRMPVDGS